MTVTLTHPSLGKINLTGNGTFKNEFQLVKFTFTTSSGKEIIKHKLMSEDEFLKLKENGIFKTF